MASSQMSSEPPLRSDNLPPGLELTTIPNSPVVNSDNDSDSDGVDSPAQLEDLQHVVSEPLKLSKERHDDIVSWTHQQLGLLEYQFAPLLAWASDMREDVKE